MITKKGPNNVAVVGKLAVPVIDICSAFITSDTITEIIEKYPLTKEEIIECILFFHLNYGPTENDFIELVCDYVHGNMSVDTAGLSDWVYISTFVRGIVDAPSEDSIMELYTIGLQRAMHEALTSVIEDKPWPNKLSEMIFSAFEKSFGKVDPMEAAVLRKTLEEDIEKNAKS